MKKRLSYHHLVLVSITILIIVYMFFKTPYFFTLANFRVLVDGFIIEAIMALGMTMVIISGGIDLTVAGILPFASILLALLMSNSIPMWFSVFIVFVVAAVIGMITNFLRKTLNLHPMVITMAIAAVLKGINLTLTGGTAISDFPESFRNLASLKILGIPLTWFVYIVLALVFLWLSHNHKSFTDVFFVGGNEEAARLSGINVERVYLRVYIISALLAALAGILTAITYSSASYSYGTNADLRVITTVAIGGTSLTRGGFGSIEGTLLGTLFMAIIYDAFVMSGISTYYQDVVTGAFLIGAVLLSEGLRVLRIKYNAKQRLA